MKSVESIVNEMDGGDAIDFLIENEDGFVVSQEELNKIKAEAVREVIDYLHNNYPHLDGDHLGILTHYANKLEEGEL